MLIAGRLVQYAAAVILFGLPAFRLALLPGPAASAERRVLITAAAALAAGALLALAGQAAAMTGDPGAALAPGVWWDVASSTQVGRAIGLRTLAGLGALAALAVSAPDRARRVALLVVGALAVASFAWSGHGAADAGAAGVALLAADVAHLWAVALWLGALVGLALALPSARRHGPGPLAAALERFAGVGSALVALILATGLVNSWILVTPSQAPRLFATAYGTLLAAKLALFGVMLGCAALNRFHLTPALRSGRRTAAYTLGLLGRSLLVETASGAAILLLVATLGLLSPPGAG